MPQVRIATTHARRGTFGFALGSLAASFGLSSVYLLPFRFPFDLPFLDLSLGFVYLGFAIGGAIGGFFLQPGPVAVRVLLMLDGGFAFAVGGAIGGATTFGLWSAVGPVFAIFIGLSSAMTIGGAVCRPKPTASAADCRLRYRLLPAWNMMTCRSTL